MRGRPNSARNQRHRDVYRGARGLALPRARLHPTSARQAGQREGEVSAVQGGGDLWGVDGVDEGSDGVTNSRLQRQAACPVERRLAAALLLAAGVILYPYA